jgi:hypothetical protein
MFMNSDKIPPIPDQLPDYRSRGAKFFASKTFIGMSLLGFLGWMFGSAVAWVILMALGALGILSDSDFLPYFKGASGGSVLTGLGLGYWLRDEIARMDGFG